MIARQTPVLATSAWTASATPSHPHRDQGLGGDAFMKNWEGWAGCSSRSVSSACSAGRERGMGRSMIMRRRASAFDAQRTSYPHGATSRHDEDDR